MYTILLEEMAFYAYHGCYESEKEKGNKFTVEIEAVINQLPTDTDNLTDTLDYSHIYKIIKKVMEQRFNLLETIAKIIAKELKITFETITQVTVKVSKHTPKIGGPCKKVSIIVKE